MAVSESEVVKIQRILGQSKTIAIVGVSANESRPSYFAAKYMQEHGYRIFPVNPRYETVLGVRCYESLEQIQEPMDIVDVFRRTEDVLPIAEQAVAIKARCLWQQLGVDNQQAVSVAQSAGLDTVVNRCVKIEFARFFGGLNWAGVNTGLVSAHRPAFFAAAPIPAAPDSGENQ